MKTKFFFFAMLVSVATSAQVTNVAPIDANYATKTVRFRVYWNAGTRNTTHLDKVWVWVDYTEVNPNNTTSGNTWTRAAVSTASVSPTSTISYDGSNRKGLWLQGSSGSYSATVTVQLSITASKFNWCAYVSDYPPNVTATNGTYTFKGTPPFTLIAANGTTTQTVSGKTLTASALTITPTTIRDKTECPGVFCIYTGSDLFIDATRLCQQRTAGAKNWEAHIRDSRDTKIYRIVLMPDNKWWLAQNVKLASYGGSTIGWSTSGCTEDECGRHYTYAQIYASYAGGTSGSTGIVQGICPPNWHLPIRATYETLSTSIGNNATIICAALRGLNSSCSPINNTYGWAPIVGTVNGYVVQRSDHCVYTNDAIREDGYCIDSSNVCNAISYDAGINSSYGAVRCFRQL